MLRRARHRRPARQFGFTLIELTITMTVSLIFFLMALPSFSGLRQRSALRGAADQALAFWNEARFEAVKRNQLVKVGVYSSGDQFCLGAATTQDEADTVPCNCLSAEPAMNACDVGRWPAAQSEWQGVRLAGASIAGSTLGNYRPVVIEPRRTTLTSSTARGTIGLAAAPGPTGYRINLNIDHLGHGLLCESLNSANRLPEFDKRRCAD
jgi:prepilin-type N-terminal cleavage/methylation domain-containing protein